MKRNNLTLILGIPILALILFGFAFIFGCGQGGGVSPGPTGWISSRYPSLAGSVTSKNANLTITFNRDMNTNYNSFAPGGSHTAGSPATYETYWIDNKTFNIFVYGPISVEAGNIVQLVSETDGFKDSQENSLPTGTELWRFSYDYNTLESYSIDGSISQTGGTSEGIVHVLVYDHEPSSYGDMGFIGYGSAETIGAYSTISDLGSGNRWIYAFRDVFGDFKWYAGYPSGKHNSGNPINLTSNEANVDVDLNADPLSIVSRSPILNETGVAKGQDWSITFNNAIRLDTLTDEAITFGPSHEAGMPIMTSSAEVSDDLRTITVPIDNWIEGTGSWVHVVTTGPPRILDVNGDYLADGETLWKYKLDTHSISGTITGATSEMLAVCLSTDETFDELIATQIVTLSAGSASYSFGGLENGTYYVACEGEGPMGRGLIGIYQNPAGSPTPVVVNNADRTDIDFPVACYTGLVSDPLNAYYLSGQITSATTESYYVSVIISTFETIFMGTGDVAGGYIIQPPPVNYYFSGLTNDTYYLAAWQKIPGNTEPTPEAGDYVGTGEATVSGGNVTNVNIYLEYFPGFP